MLCMSVLAFVFWFLMSYVCFTVCLLLGLLSFCCPFGFFFSYNTCAVYVFVFPLRKQLLCHVSDG